MPETFIDVAIVGAGAAGIAAARVLQSRKVSFQILEARGRVGGRALTIDHHGVPLDLGAGWLHSADKNPLTALASQLRFSIDKTKPPWNPRDEPPTLQPEQFAFARALNAMEKRLETAAKEKVDRPASDFLLPGCEWNPLLNAFSTFYNGAPFTEISILDYDAYDDTDVNWRVKEGYGCLVTRLAANLPVTLETPVTAIDSTGRLVRIDTPRGALHAKAVIIAVPSSVLAAGQILFRPAIPAKTEAASNLPLGLADKLFFGLREPDALPENEMLFGRLDRTETCAYHLRPFGRSYIEVYCGGPHARALERASKDERVDFAIGELVALLGSGIRKDLTPWAASKWGTDPFSCGSYSYARPGHTADREHVAQNIDGRLFFAGEACSPTHFSTVHGAYETGVAAAKEILASLYAGLNV